MLVKLYIGSVIVTFIVLWVTSEALKSKLKREGYKYNNKISWFEELHAYLAMFMPILNLFLVYACFYWFEVVYARFKAKSIKID